MELPAPLVPLADRNGCGVGSSLGVHWRARPSTTRTGSTRSPPSSGRRTCATRSRGDRAGGRVPRRRARARAGDARARRRLRTGPSSLALARRGLRGRRRRPLSADFVRARREAAAADGLPATFEELDVRDLDVDRRVRRRDLPVPGRLRAARRAATRPTSSARIARARSARAARLAVTAFSAAFAVRLLEGRGLRPGDRRAPRASPRCANPTARGAPVRPVDHVLHRPRARAARATAPGSTVDGVYGVTPGAYRAHAPTLDHPSCCSSRARPLNGLSLSRRPPYRMAASACTGASGLDPRGPPPATRRISQRGDDGIRQGVKLSDQDVTEASDRHRPRRERGGRRGRPGSRHGQRPRPERRPRPRARRCSPTAPLERRHDGRARTSWSSFDDLGGQSFADAVDATIVEFDDGDIVTGSVVKIDSDEVLLDIGFKSEGVIPSRELSIRNDVDPHEIVSLDDELEALVLQKEDKDGRLDPVEEARAVRARLGHDRGDQGEGRDRQGPGHRGGQGRPDPRHRSARLPARVARRPPSRARPPALRGPGDRVQDHRARQEPQQRRAVAPRVPRGDPARAARRVPHQPQAGRGPQRCRVSSVVNFGAFVDLGGMDGLVHVSELSWKHVDHPSSVVQVGDEVTVQVLDVDLSRERISLSLKATQQDPWQEFADQPRGRRARLRPGHQAGAVRRVRPGGRGHRGSRAHLRDGRPPRRGARAGRHPGRGALGEDHRHRPRPPPDLAVDQAGRRGWRGRRRVPGALRRARLRRAGQLHRPRVSRTERRGRRGEAGAARPRGEAADEAGASADRPRPRGRRCRPTDEPAEAIDAAEPDDADAEAEPDKSPRR